MSDRFSRFATALGATGSSSLRNKVYTFFLRYRSVILRKKREKYAMAMLHRLKPVLLRYRSKFRLYRHKKDTIPKYRFLSSRLTRRRFQFSFDRYKAKSRSRLLNKSRELRIKKKNDFLIKEAIVSTFSTMLLTFQLNKFAFNSYLFNEILNLQFSRKKRIYSISSDKISKISPLRKRILANFSKWYKYYRAFTECSPTRLSTVRRYLRIKRVMNKINGGHRNHLDLGRNRLLK